MFSLLTTVKVLTRVCLDSRHEAVQKCLGRGKSSVVKQVVHDVQVQNSSAKAEPRMPPRWQAAVDTAAGASKPASGIAAHLQALRDFQVILS